MSKMIIGLLVILLIAGLLSGGLYLLVQNGTINVQLLGAVSNLGGRGVGSDETFSRLGSGGNARGGSTSFVPARQPLEDLTGDSFGLGNRFLIGLNDILHNLFLIAGITMAVVLVEKVLSAFWAKSHTTSLK
ncbi:MAG: hypothetical protein ABSA51_13640 [Anaerolineaceae bacterium]